MSKGLRLSEKWFNRALWLVAFMFAWFLVGLGGALIRDLPKVEKPFQLEQFLDASKAKPLQQNIRNIDNELKVNRDKLDQAYLTLTTRQNDYQAVRRTFENWLATRDVTQQNSQDDELVTRTKALDGLKAKEREAEVTVEKYNQADLDLNQKLNLVRSQLAEVETVGYDKMNVANQKQDTRIFLYRLLLTLPLLAGAAWLFAKKRKSKNWPFAWGFIIFALIAFFFELVPYLPDYGGYVRYVVGVLITIFGGKYAINALQNYLEKQKLAEAQPQAMRREELSYDVALTRLGKGVCPGCERGVDLKDTRNDFCPHCGIGLHNKCGTCNIRKNAFSKFCNGCGAHALINA